MPAPAAPTISSATGRVPASIVILGGGAAGIAAANTLRQDGYDGPVTMISADADPPVDRPNLSKDYLAGEAQDDWIPMWPPDLYQERRVELLLNSRVSSHIASANTPTGAPRAISGTTIHDVEPSSRRILRCSLFCASATRRAR